MGRIKLHGFASSADCYLSSRCPRGNVAVDSVQNVQPVQVVKILGLADPNNGLNILNGLNDLNRERTEHLWIAQQDI